MSHSTAVIIGRCIVPKIRTSISYLSTSFHIFAEWIDAEAINTNLMLIMGNCMSIPCLVNWVSLLEIAKVLTSYSGWSPRVSVIISNRKSNAYNSLCDNMCSIHVGLPKIAASDKMAEWPIPYHQDHLFAQCHIIKLRQQWAVKGLSLERRHFNHTKYRCISRD